MYFGRPYYFELVVKMNLIQINLILVAFVIFWIDNYSNKVVSKLEICSLESCQERMRFDVKRYQVESRKEASSLPQKKRVNCDELAKKFFPIGSPAKDVMDDLREHSITECESQALPNRYSIYCEEEYRKLTGSDNYRIQLYVSSGSGYADLFNITVVGGKIADIVCRRQFY